MRTVVLTKREARLLRDNLTLNQQGYDYVDLRRMDYLARKLNDLQGEYATEMAKLGLEEKRIRRAIARKQGRPEDHEAELVELQFRVDELNEEADKASVRLVLEDGDYKLISDKLHSVERWMASDELRPVILGLMEAVDTAEQYEAPTLEAEAAEGAEPLAEPGQVTKLHQRR